MLWLHLRRKASHPHRLNKPLQAELHECKAGPSKQPMLLYVQTAWTISLAKSAGSHLSEAISSWECRHGRCWEPAACTEKFVFKIMCPSSPRLGSCRPWFIHRLKLDKWQQWSCLRCKTAALARYRYRLDAFAHTHSLKPDILADNEKQKSRRMLHHIYHSVVVIISVSLHFMVMKFVCLALFVGTCPDFLTSSRFFWWVQFLCLTNSIFFWWVRFFVLTNSSFFWWVRFFHKFHIFFVGLHFSFFSQFWVFFITFETGS